ncbi:MAG: hypothetical protein A4E74_01816 [Syntrophus sp. PtaB.Bin075]|nr:MAG: hypothetical protein A4E74_01816 [Syntrophus sp. PtaB.Bin075]
MLFKLQGKPLMCRIRFGHHEQTGSILVQAVDDSRTHHPADTRQIPAMEKEGIDEGARDVTRRRMDDQTCRLVQNKDVMVLIQNGKRDIMRDKFQRGCRGFFKHHDIAGSKLLTRPDFRLPADGHPAAFNKTLQPGSGKAGFMAGKKEIQPQATLRRSYPVLPEWRNTLHVD